MSRVQPLDSALLRTMSLPRPGDGGKDERGRVLIAGGGPQLPGAVLLAGDAAARASCSWRSPPRPRPPWGQLFRRRG